MVGSIYGRSSIKDCSSSWSINKHGHHRQFLFLIGRFLKVFSSETAWRNTANLYRKHLWKVLYMISSFHADWTKTWSPRAILVSDWLKFIKKSSPLKLGGTMNCYFVEMMYGRSLHNFHISFRSHNLYGRYIVSSCLWLTNQKKPSLKPFGQINQNLVGRTYGRFCIMFPQNKMTC